MAFLPFLNVTGLGLRISRFVLHFTQYASIGTSTNLICGQFTTFRDRVTVDSHRKARQHGDAVSRRRSPVCKRMTATCQMGTTGKLLEVHTRIVEYDAVSEYLWPTTRSKDG